MRLRKLLFFILTGTFISIGSQAQIYAPDASDSLITSYGTDEIFIFNRPEFRAEINASVIAFSVDLMTDWTFQWSVYDPQDSAYRTLPGTTTGRSSQLDTLTVSSGYMVQITRGIETDSFRVWVIINDLDVKILNKDESDTLLYGYYDCKSLDLHSDTLRPALFYYNPFTHEKLDPGNLYTIRWTTDNPEAATPNSRLLTRVSNPPWKDTWYKITVSDRFGIMRSDSVIYNSIVPKAVIPQPDYINPGNELLNNPPRAYIEHFYDYPDGVYSAPALFKFDVSGSKNMVKYELDFGDGDSVLMGNDSLLLYHEFKKPGTYKVVLTAQSGKPFECVHSDSTIPPVTVDFAKEDNFNMPNVFTPGDGDVIEFNENTINDVFRTTDVSVVFIDITIFTRTGRKVHEFEGNIRDWEGWNGRIMNTGVKAPTGVYFYVITQLGAYQDSTNPIKQNILKGFIHLYRE